MKILFICSGLTYFNLLFVQSFSFMLANNVYSLRGYLPLIQGTYVISLYGDVFKNRAFFSKTYPWIIDNIGGEINVDYYLLGSGKYSIPQMCALEQLRLNTFLQAQYLKCEAEGNGSESCLCESGVDPVKYKNCVLTKGSYASFASRKYDQLSIDASPVIELGYKNTVFEVEDSWYLKKICTIFGDSPPRGCIKPFACNTTETFERFEKSGAVVFNCDCCKWQQVTPSYTYQPTTSTTLTPPEAYTSKYYD